MKNLLILFAITVIMFNGCIDEETCDCVPPPECDKAVIVDSNKYDNAPNDDMNITDAKIVNDCLTITFGSSGCDGSTWQLALYDAGVIMESYPPQRNIRLSLKNEELCDAYFLREVQYNLLPLKDNGETLVLNLQGLDTPLVYEY